MARPKKYSIQLTENELKKLKSVIRKKETSKTIRSRCQIILDLDEAHGKGWKYIILQNTGADWTLLKSN